MPSCGPGLHASASNYEDSSEERALDGTCANPDTKGKTHVWHARHGHIGKWRQNQSR